MKKGIKTSRWLAMQPGLYQFSRNPIYLGMIGSLAGITLTLPTWFSIAMAAGVVGCFRTQTIEEEPRAMFRAAQPTRAERVALDVAPSKATITFGLGNLMNLDKYVGRALD